MMNMDQSTLDRILIQLADKARMTPVIVPLENGGSHVCEPLRRRSIVVGEEGEMTVESFARVKKILDWNALDGISEQDKREFFSWIIGEEAATTLLAAEAEKKQSQQKELRTGIQKWIDHAKKVHPKLTASKRTTRKPRRKARK